MWSSLSAMLCVGLALKTASVTAAAVHQARANSPDCGSLLQSHLDPSIKISKADSIAAGTLNLTALAGSTVALNKVAFCRVQGSIVYGVQGNDTLLWELFLPDPSTYNGKFLAVGNGGLAGNIDYATMMTQLNSGFAVAACDAGHQLSKNGNGTVVPGQAIPFLQDPVQVQAWIHNSIAMMTTPTRSLAANYYSSVPKYSYYYGCSTGGAQGFALAQFYPTLFDGIYAGSPGNWYSHLALSFLWNAQHSQGSAAISQDVLTFVTNAVLDACDHLDGVTDRVIENPLKCSFNISSLQCKDGQQSTSNNKTVCLTSQQVTTMQAIYTGPKDSRDGTKLYPGFDIGSEIEWALQEGTLSNAFTVPILQNLVFGNLSYNASSFNWGTDVDAIDKYASPLIDEISFDLSAFRNRGGKLITTQGWADPYNAATWPMQHWQQIQSTIGKNITDFMELFMVPGGGHCGAASFYPHVPATYHVLDVLMPWVENGTKPSSMISSTPPDGSNSTRLLCAWPQTASYQKGNQSLSQSYVCA